MSQPIVDEVLRALSHPKVRKYIPPGLDPELWFEDSVVLSHLVAGERELAGAAKTLTMTNTLRRRLKVERSWRSPEIRTSSICKSTTASGL